MAAQENVKVEATEDGLLISGSSFQDGKSWQARMLGKNRVLLDKPAGPQSMMGDKAGFGLMERSTYISLLIGLSRQHFDGVVSIDLGNAVKRLFFRSGELVFAGSNLIDDRLGEVIYREGLITLDQLTEAAVEVNRTTKFGKVLIENEVFSCSQLWDALKLQVSTIFQSTFLQDYLYIQIDAGDHTPPTLVSLDQSTEELIDDCAGYAAMVWQFRQRMDAKTKLRRADSIDASSKAAEGTFLGDTVELVSQHANIADFLRHSKLTEVNTLCAIFDLVHHHVLTVENFDPNPRGLDSGPRMKPIKGLIDAYQLIVDGAQKAFAAEGAQFPVREIELFLDRQYRYRSPIFVLPDGSIGNEAMVSIYTKARSSVRQSELVLGQMGSLVRFLLQIVGDLLPGGKGWEVKKSFQNMIA